MAAASWGLSGGLHMLNVDLRLVDVAAFRAAQGPANPRFLQPLKSPHVMTAKYPKDRDNKIDREYYYQFNRYPKSLFLEWVHRQSDMAAAFSLGGAMNYQAFTNGSLTMMYEAGLICEWPDSATFARNVSQPPGPASP